MVDVRSCNNYLFVYGTLRQQAKHPMAQWLGQHAQWVTTARLQGCLYAVEGYPGVILSNDPQQQVIGDVYLLTQPAHVLERLDQYEQCSAEFALPHEYTRQHCTVYDEKQRQITAWVYLYNEDVSTLRCIRSGDWLDELPQR